MCWRLWIDQTTTPWGYLSQVDTPLRAIFDPWRSDPDIKAHGLDRPAGGEVARDSNFSRYRLSHHFKTVLDDQPGELFAVDQFDRDTLVLFVAFRLSLRLRAEVP